MDSPTMAATQTTKRAANTRRRTLAMHKTDLRRWQGVRCHENPGAEDGYYLLGPDAYLYMETDSVDCPDDLFDEAWDYGMDEVAPTPNPMNTKTHLLRRQCTFGASYSFGRQRSADHGPLEDAPELVRAALSKARMMAPQYGIDPLEMTGVHVNWYPFGRAGLMAHQDTETVEEPAAPVFSFSFVRNRDAAAEAEGWDYRCFCISRDKAQKQRVATIALRDGDLLVMYGKRFQKDLWHSLLPTTSTRATQLECINVTVRVWGGASRVRDVKELAKQPEKQPEKQAEQQAQEGAEKTQVKTEGAETTLP
jgi:alkylated DNA repair dioxygenase AlkB